MSWCLIHLFKKEFQNKTLAQYGPSGAWIDALFKVLIEKDGNESEPET